MNAMALDGTANAIITAIGEVVTAGMTWLGDAATAVTGNTLLLTFTCISLVGVGIGLLKRVIS